jgi:DNA-binding MarR family transcriptional regulator/GNAT superfamily N-acetyltransferase
MNTAVPDTRVDAVREFNRMYTKVVGALDEGLLHTPYSLTEARVLFELAHRDAVPVSALRQALDLDAGYLSRLLGRFETDRLVHRERSEVDARQQVVRLTAPGREAFALLDARSSEQVRTLLAGVAEDGQRRLVAAMAEIRSQLGARPAPDTVVLRPPRPGELGWVVSRHGTLYAAEYGWDSTFEGLTAGVIADFLAGNDPRCEAAWIAEVRGEPAGSIFCVRKDKNTAKLRLLLVEPAARGHGVGSRLVGECVSFARGAGYRAMELWTVSVLHAARRIYQQAGFQLVTEEQRDMFGQHLTGQTWRLGF